MMASIPFFRPDLTGNEERYVLEVLRSGWLTTASRTATFEQRFKDSIQAGHALAVNSCTAGLHLALEAIGISRGDKVLVPSLTFTASAEVVRYLDAHPVICDVDLNTGLITPELVRKALRENGDIRACVVVHYAGQSAEMTNTSGNGILEICAQHGVKVVVDAAHAFPAYDDYGPVGSVGDATCFSFYANKTITTGEGGMLATNDDAVAARSRLMRLHGIDRDVWDRFTKSGAPWLYDVIAPGYKYNMADLNAAVGLAQLERAEVLRRERERCAARYITILGEVEQFELLRMRVPMSAHSWHLFPIIVNDSASVGRDQLIQGLTECGIGTSVHYRPLHRMTYYAESYALRPEDFPGAERFWNRAISLPIYPSLRNDEIDYICEQLVALTSA